MIQVTNRSPFFFFPQTGPGSPAPRVRPDLQAQEDGAARVRRFAVRQLRAGPHRARLPDRGAEDRQEGAEGAGGQEEVKWGGKSKLKLGG